MIALAVLLLAACQPKQAVSAPAAAIIGVSISGNTSPGVVVQVRKQDGLFG
jgi:hypothetical protein